MLAKLANAIKESSISLVVPAPVMFQNVSEEETDTGDRLAEMMQTVRIIARIDIVIMQVIITDLIKYKLNSFSQTQRKLTSFNIMIFIFYRFFNSICLQYPSNTKITQMLQEKQYQIKLKDPLTGIAKIFPAFNETFLVVGNDFTGPYPSYSQFFCHINRNGQLLFKYQNKNISRSESLLHPNMISDRKVAFFETKLNCIATLNIRTHEIQRFPHSYLTQQINKAKMYYFHLSNILCVSQYIIQESKLKIRVSYYCALKFKIIKQYSTEYPQKMYGMVKFIKINNHSMLIYSKECETNFSIYTLDEMMNIQLGSKIKQFLLESACLDKPNEIFLSYCFKRQKWLTFKVKLEDKKLPQVKLFLQYKDTYPSLYKLRSFGEYRSNATTNKGFEINFLNVKGRTIKTITNKLSSFGSAEPIIQFLDYHQSLIVAESKKWDYNQLIIHILQAYNWKSVQLHFLLHLNQDFDDDLLLDAVNLLEQEK